MICVYSSHLRASFLTPDKEWIQWHKDESKIAQYKSMLMHDTRNETLGRCNIVKTCQWDPMYLSYKRFRNSERVLFYSFFLAMPLKLKIFLNAEKNQSVEFSSIVQSIVWRHKSYFDNLGKSLVTCIKIRRIWSWYVSPCPSELWYSIPAWESSTFPSL